MNEIWEEQNYLIKVSSFNKLIWLSKKKVIGGVEPCFISDKFKYAYFIYFD